MWLVFVSMMMLVPVGETLRFCTGDATLGSRVPGPICDLTASIRPASIVCDRASSLLFSRLMFLTKFRPVVAKKKYSELDKKESKENTRMKDQCYLNSLDFLSCGVLGK